MAGTTNARGGLGWVILVIALAVPGVLFYNWWSHLKAEREKAVAAKARGRVPEGGVFQSSPNAKLVNPMAPIVSTAAPSAAAALVAATPAVLAAIAVAAEPAVLAAVAVAAEPAPSVTAQPASVSTMTASAPPLKRDPMLSPFDQVRINEQEEVKRKAAEDLENMKNRKNRLSVNRVADPRTLVDLQGVISSADGGHKAIVNNEVVGPGEMLGKIRIVRISDSGIVFEYQGKRYSKSVSKD